MIGCLNIQCEFCPQYWLWSRWCSQSKVYICFQLSYSATTTATARNKEFFSYMFWRLFGWSAKICDFQPEWHFVFLFVLKDLKREISRFVENGFPIFRSSCWPDLAQGSVCKQVCVVCSVQTSQVGSKIPNKWQQFASPVTKSPGAILPSGNSGVQKVIFALSNFENVSKTLPKIGFWCVVQFARFQFSSDGNFKNLLNDILPYHIFKYYPIREKSTCPDLREIQMRSCKKNLQETLLRFQLLCWTDVRSRALTKRKKDAKSKGAGEASKDLEIFHFVSLNSWWLEELRSSRLLLVATSTPRGELMFFQLCKIS